MSIKSDLRFAIVGAGKIGCRHAMHIHEKAILSVVCDINNEKANLLAGQYGAESFDSLNAILKNDHLFDVVVICTPNGLHAEQAIKSLKQGKHVVCEKPMALFSADCRKMIQEAEESNKKLFIVKQNRYNSPVVALKKLIDEHRLGKILSIQLNCFWNRNVSYYEQDQWRGSRTFDGGVLFTQFSHFVDLMLWVVNDEVVSIQTMMDNFMHQGVADFDDTGVVNLRFSRGAIGAIHFTTNSYRKNMEGSLTIFGEKGTFKIGGEYLNKVVYQELEGGSVEISDLTNEANDYGSYTGSMSNHGLFYNNVIDVLEHGAAMTTNADQAHQTVELIERIYAARYDS